MNDRSRAIQILQEARDRLSERLTQRVVESRDEIVADADGGSYLSEIETIYDQLGSRLAHVNAMLTNLPPETSPAVADATATEIIYADLASASTTGFELEASTPPTMLALPAPAGRDERDDEDPLAEALRQIAVLVQTGDFAEAARLIGNYFDLRPSQSERLTATLASQFARRPELPRQLAELGGALTETGDEAAETLVAEWFDFERAEAVALVRALARRSRGTGRVG